MSRRYKPCSSISFAVFIVVPDCHHLCSLSLCEVRHANISNTDCLMNVAFSVEFVKNERGGIGWKPCLGGMAVVAREILLCFSLKLTKAQFGRKLQDCRKEGARKFGGNCRFLFNQMFVLGDVLGFIRLRFSTPLTLLWKVIRGGSTSLLVLLTWRMCQSSSKETGIINPNCRLFFTSRFFIPYLWFHSDCHLSLCQIVWVFHSIPTPIDVHSQ